MVRVTDTGLSVAAAVVVAWGVSAIWPEVNMPEPVAAALGAIIGPLIEDVRNVRRKLLGRWLDGG